MSIRDRIPNVRDIKRRFHGADYAAIRHSISDRILNPGFLAKRIDVATVTRSSQWFAALMLPILIIITLPFILAIQDVISGILNVESFGYDSILGFFVTFIGLGQFCMAAYLWFQWVRTGGFKLFEI